LRDAIFTCSTVARFLPVLVSSTEAENSPVDRIFCRCSSVFEPRLGHQPRLLSVSRTMRLLRRYPHAVADRHVRLDFDVVEHVGFFLLDLLAEVDVRREAQLDALDRAPRPGSRP
jgi:hypothetical protein